jgi:hypothetical protein
MANLDDHRRDNLAEQILNVKEFSQLFVISHEDTFEGDAKHVVRVVKEYGANQVVASYFCGLSQRIRIVLCPPYIGVQRCSIGILGGLRSGLRLPKKWVARAQPLGCAVVPLLVVVHWPGTPHMGASRPDPLRKPFVR